MKSIAIILLASAACLQGQQFMRLTLEEAKDMVVRTNPRVAAAQDVAAAANQVPSEYRAGLFPTVSGAITVVGADSGSRLAAGALNNPVVYNRLGTGVVVNQLVTDFGRTGNLVSAARFHGQAQDQTTNATRADILLATTQAYYSLLRAQAVLTIARGTVSARQTVSEQVTALAASNLKSQLDVSFANVNLSDARLLQVQAENSVKAAAAELARLLGLPGQTEFDVQDTASTSPLPATPDAMVGEALQNRPELKGLRLEQTSAERLVSAEHASFYPSVTIVGTAGFAPLAESTIPGRYGAIGANLNIPVFNGGLFRARQNEAQFKAKAVQDNLKDLADRVTRDVRVAYLNAQTAEQRVGLTDQLLQQAQLAESLARGRYDLGLSSIVELTQAQLNLTGAQISNTTARYDLAEQRSVLDHAIGNLR